MKNRYLDIIAFPVVAISIATLLVNGVSAQAATPDVQKIIDDRVEAEYAPAIVVGIVRKDGTKEFYFAGTLQAGGTEEVDKDTIFEIGSITKMFTTLLMTLMEEDGDLEFSDTAQRFLPAGVSMPTKKGISNPNGNIPLTHITLKHLATHTSGLPRMPSNIIEPSDTPTEIWASPCGLHVPADV